MRPSSLTTHTRLSDTGKKTPAAGRCRSLARMVKGAKEIALVAGGKGPLSAEHHRQDAIVLGRVDAGRASTLRFGKRDLLTVERTLDARIEHINREAEARDRIPVGMRAYLPEIKPRI